MSTPSAGAVQRDAPPGPRLATLAGVAIALGGGGCLNLPPEPDFWAWYADAADPGDDADGGQPAELAIEVEPSEAGPSDADAPDDAAAARSDGDALEPDAPAAPDTEPADAVRSDADAAPGDTGGASDAGDAAVGPIAPAAVVPGPLGVRLESPSYRLRLTVGAARPLAARASPGYRLLLGPPIPPPVPPQVP